MTNISFDATIYVKKVIFIVSFQPTVTFYLLNSNCVTRYPSQV